MNKFFKTAACLGIVDLIFFLSYGFTATITSGTSIRLGSGADFSKWNTETLDANLGAVISLIMLALAAAFAIAGILALRESKSSK